MNTNIQIHSQGGAPNTPLFNPRNQNNSTSPGPSQNINHGVHANTGGVGGKGLTGQQASGSGQAQAQQFQYINKQVNKSNLTLNVRNFNNRINNININNIQDNIDTKLKATQNNIKDLNTVVTSTGSADQPGGGKAGMKAQSSKQNKGNENQNQFPQNQSVSGINQMNIQSSGQSGQIIRTQRNYQGSIDPINRESSLSNQDSDVSGIISQGMILQNLGRSADQTQISQYLQQQQQTLSNFNQGGNSAAKDSSPNRNGQIFTMGQMNNTGSARNSIGKSIQQSADIASTTSSRPNVNYKNIQGGISVANGGVGLASKSQHFLNGIANQQSNNQNTPQTTDSNKRNSTGQTQTRNSSAQSKTGQQIGNLRSSTSSSILNLGMSAQRINQTISGSQAHRQSSYGPTSSQNINTGLNSAVMSQTFQVNNVVSNDILNKSKSILASKRSSSSTQPQNILNQKENQNSSVMQATIPNNRSNSRTSAQSASNISATGSASGTSIITQSASISAATGTPSVINNVSAKFAEQQQVISRQLEKEKKYLEKIKQLKGENKKLVQLLKDSEKLFYQKLQESKQQSSSLSVLIKQLWPVIKTKVKDPTLLMNTINMCVSSSQKSDWQDHPAVPFINDIELITKEEAQKNNSKNDDSMAQEIERRHQQEIQELQKTFQEHIIKMDNQYGKIISDNDHELYSLQKASVLLENSYTYGPISFPSTGYAIGSAAIRALNLHIDDEDLFGDDRATVQSGSIEDLAVGRFQKSSSKSRASNGAGSITKQTLSMLEFRKFGATSALAQDSSARILQLSQQRLGRNQQRQSTDISVLGGKPGSSFTGKVGGVSQTLTMTQMQSSLQYSKSAQNLNLRGQQTQVINQQKIQTGIIPSQSIKQMPGTTQKVNTQEQGTRGQLINNFVDRQSEPRGQKQQESRSKSSSHNHQGSILNEESGPGEKEITKQKQGLGGQLLSAISNKNTFSFGFR